MGLVQVPHPGVPVREELDQEVLGREEPGQEPALVELVREELDQEELDLVGLVQKVPGLEELDREESGQ